MAGAGLTCSVPERTLGSRGVSCAARDVMEMQLRCPGMLQAGGQGSAGAAVLPCPPCSAISARPRTWGQSGDGQWWNDSAHPGLDPAGWDGHQLKKNKVRLGKMPGRTVVRQNPWVFCRIWGTSKFPQAERRNCSSARSLPPMLSPS